MLGNIQDSDHSRHLVENDYNEIMLRIMPQILEEEWKYEKQGGEKVGARIRETHSTY
jgi:hypothetical protein